MVEERRKGSWALKPVEAGDYRPESFGIALLLRSSFFHPAIFPMNDLRNKLWYDRPALDGNSALPVGNGRLGGMVFGRLREETIQLNEDSIWYGGPRNRINPNGRENLGRIRELRAETRLQCGENQSDDSGLLAFPMDIREQVVLHPGYRKTIE